MTEFSCAGELFLYIFLLLKHTSIFLSNKAGLNTVCFLKKKKGLEKGSVRLHLDCTKLVILLSLNIFSCVAVHNAVLSLLELVFLTVKCVFLNRKICECGQTVYMQKKGFAEALPHNV